MGVAPDGQGDDPPLGVKTKTSSCSRSIFRLAMNSSGSEVSCCQSTMRLSQARSSSGRGRPCSSSGRPRPNSARACISRVRICTSSGLPCGPDHRGVQRLVEVELGHGDVVLEPPLHRLPRGVDGAQRGVAVLDRVDDDPDADQVEDVVELAALDDHLLVDAPQVLRAAGDLGLDAQLGQALAAPVEHLGEVEVALGAAGGDHVVDLGVALGVQGGEGEVLELLA
jgi:hypothetical protein